ncbi:nucleotidyltransferase family protein [Candidatus Woesearchaeota archaeon]|nr:nucleotidyltransferase family protein [Candidatus Woesearchaeota archaeon]
MDAVILAAGKGERLKPLTDNIPKGMVIIDNKPILEHTIKLLVKNRINKIYIVVNYKKEIIINFVDSIKNKYKLEAYYIHQQELLGTAHATSLIPNNISNPFLLILGDVVFYDFPNSLPLKPTIFVKKTDDTINKGIIEIKNGIITNFHYNKEKLNKEKFVDIGFMVLTKEVIENCKEYKYIKDTPIVEVINNMIQNGVKFLAENFKGEIRHITSIEDINR